MRRWLAVVCTLVLAVTVLGCHSDAEKGLNKHKERPVAADKQDKADKK